MGNSVSTDAKPFFGSADEVTMGRGFTTATAMILVDGANAHLTASPYIDHSNSLEFTIIDQELVGRIVGNAIVHRE
jgi:hypothetical protein